MPADRVAALPPGSPPGEIPPHAYVLIIGAMKSGTSSLFSHLAEHPAICPARIKEPEYFSENQGHGLQVERYGDLWDFDPRLHRYAMEASTGYAKYPHEPHVAARIAAAGLTPKFIYILRDPVERIESHYNFMRFDPAFQGRPTDDYLIDVSNYYLQLSAYRPYFPGDSLLLLDFALLKQNPRSLLVRVCEFLGISSAHLPDSLAVENATPRVSQAELTVLRSSMLRRLAGWAPRPLRRAAQRWLARATPMAQRRLTVQERDHVRARLRPDMLRLQREYGFDVRPWGFTA